MHYRDVLLEDDLVLADSGTKAFNINIGDPITELQLRYSMKNGGAVTSMKEPEGTISKIEIVDGGQTYLSMTGREAVAVAVYEKGHWPSHRYIENANSTQRIVIPLQFGRFLGDPLYAFDPSKLSNPQVRVTWAKDSLHATGEVRMGITARVMEDGPRPNLCLMTKQVEAWTGGSSGVKKVEMLTDLPYRRMFIRSYLYGSTLENLFSHLKFTCDADKLVVFDIDDSEFGDIIRSQFGEFTVYKFDYFETGALDYKDCLIDGRTRAVGTCGTQALYSIFWASGANYYSCRVYDHGGTETVSNLEVQITGDFPHATYCYQFGRPNDPASWFNAPKYRDIDLNLTEGGAAVNSVLVQQPRALP